ncbi:MAG: lchAA, partial [Bacilli bacterium]|nr:lchAA [Bacilli bacterium]
MQVVYYPLTNAQKRIWYTEQFYPGTSLANLGGFAKLKSETAINCNMLMQAIQQLVRLNDSMRLRLVPDDEGEPSQYVADYKKFDIELFDCTKAGDDRAITEWGHAEAHKPIPIYDSDLFYFAIFKINSRETWLFAKVHHVIADGISMVLLTNQIIDMYLKLEKGQQEPHFKQPSYAEHIQSELQYERSERFKKDKRFWHEQYESIPEFTVLKRKESYVKHMEAVRFSKVISDSLQSEIQGFCKQNNISVLSLFLSLVDIYTYRTTGQQDVVVGTFMANRTNANEKQMLGMFVSTIPIRTHIDENTEFLAFVSRKMKDQLSIIRHQKYPYNVLVNDLREKHGAINKLFGMSLEFQVMQWQQQENISYLIEPLFSGYELNDISIHVKERWDNGTLAIDIDYRTDLFSHTEINTIFQCIMTLLEDALAHPDKKLFELEICAEDEKQRLLQQFIRPGMPYTQSMTLPDLFEQQVE